MEPTSAILHTYISSSWLDSPQYQPSFYGLAHPGRCFWPRGGWSLSLSIQLLSFFQAAPCNGVTGLSCFWSGPGTERWRVTMFHILSLKDGLNYWPGLQVLRIRDRWWVFIMLLSIIGVLQKLLTGMNRLKNPVVFVLICLLLGVDPMLGNHSD